MRVASRLPFVLSVLAASVVAASVPAFAQGAGSQRGGGSLFGGSTSEPGRKSLLFTLSLAEAYDDDVLGELGAGFDPRVARESGYFTSLTANAAYRRRGGRVDFAGTAASAIRYIGKLDEIRPVSHTGSLGMSARLSPRTTFSADQTAAYAPSPLYSLFPGFTERSVGDAPVAAPDYALHQSESYLYGTNVSLTRAFSGRSRIRAAADFQYTDYVRESLQRQDLTSHGVTGQFSRRLGRNSGVMAGYRYRAADFGSGTISTTTEHGADIGVEFSRARSATRQTRVSLNVGTSRLSVPGSGNAGLPAGDHYHLLGAAEIAHQFRRTWEARAAYRSEVAYVADLNQPVLVDGVTAILTGMLRERLDLTVMGAYSRGQSALQRNSLVFDSYTGTVRIRRAVTATLAVYAEYLYYFYDFGAAATRAPDVPSGLERNGVRVGLTFWMSPLGR